MRKILTLIALIGFCFLMDSFPNFEATVQEAAGVILEKPFMLFQKYNDIILFFWCIFAGGCAALLFGDSQRRKGYDD